MVESKGPVPHDSNNSGVEVKTVPGKGAGLFAVRDFQEGDVVCYEKPLMCYDLRPEMDAISARVSKFLAPHRSIREGGKWGDDSPGALPYAFQWTLFLAKLSLLSECEREYVDASFYVPSIGDGVIGVQIEA